MEVIFQCEINTFGRKVLQKHWPHVQLVGDINQVVPEEIPDAELWCGGFPCQDLSLANQGKRKGFGGARSGLFFRFAELIASSRQKPRWLVIENVPGLLNSHEGRDFKVLLETPDKLGYGVSWRVLDAKYFGTPQRRRRVYLVASFGNLSAAEVLFEPGGIKIAARAGLGERKTSSESHGADNHEASLYTIQHAGIGRKHTAGPQAKGYRNDGEAYTLDSRRASDAVCTPDDAFGVRDAARIPAGLDGHRYRAAGNAVTVQVAEWIGRRIIAVEALDEVDHTRTVTRPPEAVL